MKTRSAKNKGKRLQNKVKELLVEKFKSSLEDGDFKSTTMGGSKLSYYVRIGHSNFYLHIYPAVHRLAKGFWE